MTSPAHVSVVDDDQSVRESLPDLLRFSGFEAAAFASAADFLASDSLDKTDCLILDVAMPGMSGPELLTELRRQSRNMPVIFITANGNGTTRKNLIQHGGVDCLFKPFDPDVLVQAVHDALATQG